MPLATWIVLLDQAGGGSEVSATPVEPGLEYEAPASLMHYAAPPTLMHYEAPANLMHAAAPKD